MRRERQSVEEILQQLSTVETTWRDDVADSVIKIVSSIPPKKRYDRSDLVALLEGNSANRKQFDAVLTVIRLFLDISKDDFQTLTRDRLGGTLGLQRLKKEPETVYSALESFGLLELMSKVVNTPVTWHELLTERLKGGRGSAIKGQRRGRFLEDFVERVLLSVFDSAPFDSRCQFIGATGTSVEKADFAIPNKKDPAILIEVKAYGATGSKQTDVLGDITRIVAEKRPDTHFLLVTDGVTWRERESDLRKLVELQNRGQITRIYTQSMGKQLESDLRQLKTEHGL